MASNRSWQTYPDNYRVEEIQVLVNWIATGESGSVVGLAGCGRSNVLGFLCHRPEILQQHLPSHAKRAVAILVDLNNLPTNDLSTLYRVILRAFYQFRDRFAQPLTQTITDFYLENRAAQDPFLPQSALHDLLTQLQDEEIQVALVLNRFDRFCQTATPQMLNTLRGLRDSFKDTLCYIVGMRQEVGYFSDHDDLGDMYELLDNHVCWIGAMSDSDARYMISTITYAASTALTQTEIEEILALSGRFPILIKALCHWWLNAPQSARRRDQLEAVGWADGSLQFRLDRIWHGLTQEEQLVLSEIQKLHLQKSVKKRHKGFVDLTKRQSHVLDRLVAKGLGQSTENGWKIAGGLLTTFVTQTEGRSRGKIWLDEKTGELYQGRHIIQELTDLQAKVLRFFVQNPRLPHPKTDLIFENWPEKQLREGEISDDAVFQVIREIRKAIEPNPSDPRYLITWRAKPEGGYRFFPEGKPE